MSKEIEVVWWNGQRGSWCQSIVEFLTEGMTHRMGIKELQGDGAIVVVKADQFLRKSLVEEFHLDTVSMKWMLLVVTANEEIGLPVALYQRSGNFKKWLQTPHRYQECDRAIPWGWTPGCAKERNEEKAYDWSFAGQITHSRRKEFFRVAKEMIVNRMLVPTLGFSQGIPQGNYYEMLSLTRVAPCPSGPITVDSMRVAEALQMGAVPILDLSSPIGFYAEYWNRVFGTNHPLVGVENWNAFPDLLETILSDWTVQSARTANWWLLWKANLQATFNKDLHDLGAF